ncbi:MAG: cell division/cell wall cluster transcriptional repressor MraZ [Bifidobacteriaceae bacterium]|jgi:MraZ protein|nr:cell division/cell wall cluster transcriptional repressor MraZ [Bifidobacteriaceae bacterium]
MSEAWGESFIKLDDKHRIILPAKARPAMADGTYLTKGQGDCVFLFSKPQFDDYRERNQAAAPVGMAPIDFDRVFYSSVVPQDMDKQGRISVPVGLRDYAGLAKDLAVIGMATHTEIWDAGRWRAYLEQIQAQYSQLKEGVR